MTKRRSASPWLAYIGVALTCATIGWAAVTQWFTLLQRVHDLEREQHYLHGDITVPKE